MSSRCSHHITYFGSCPGDSDITTPADMNNANAQSSIGATPFAVEGHASGRPTGLLKGQFKGKRKRSPPTSGLSPAAGLPQSPIPDASTMVEVQNHVAPGPNAEEPTGTDTEDEGKECICHWDGCNDVLTIKNTTDYSRHLALAHDFHGASRNDVVTCPWTDGAGRCEKELQMQSLFKHVCETHMNCLETWCSLCTSHQARADNLARHLRACTPFAKLSEDEQRLHWEKTVKRKPFQYYLDMRALKRQKMRR